MCIAAGPSLTEHDLGVVENYRRNGGRTVHAIAINNVGLAESAPLCAPWADIMYAADRVFWDHYRPDFAGMRVTGDPPINDYEQVQLKMLATGTDRMPRTPGSVITGNHSGFQALGLALTLGVSCVYLLGYDCGVIAGERWAHPDRDEKFRRESPFQNWLPAYQQVAAEWPLVEIINCSMQSHLEVFRKVPIKELL